MDQHAEDIFFMKKALKEADKAFLEGEVPIGVIVIDEKKKIIGKGYNLVEKHKQQIAHAEMIALTKACKRKNDWRLNGCTIYVTLEPCFMCMGLVLLSRVDRLVYAGDSNLFGHHLDKERKVPLYKEGIIKVERGILKDEAIALLRQFFKQKRK